MLSRKLFFLAGVAVSLTSPALAQTSPNSHGPFDTNQPQTAPQGTPGSPFFNKTQGYTTGNVITPGTAFPGSSAIGYVCTTAGTATLTMSGGGTMTVPVAVSTAFQVLPLSATNVTLTTAVCTLWAMQ